MADLLKVKDLSKEYTDSTGYTNLLFSGLNFELEEGKITTILAPTGSGKSSLLKIIAGLEEASNGEVISDSNKRIYIPSGNSIFPWLDVKSNINYNLSNTSETEVSEAVNFVGLEGYEDHFPHEKSYGFLLRVALARAIVRKPDLIVLDEPFDKVKPSVRQSLINLVININRKFGITIIIASANIGRALFTSDKLIIMQKNPGEIVDQINIDYTKERNSDLYNSEEYSDLKKKVESIINSVSSLKEHEFTL